MCIFHLGKQTPNGRCTELGCAEFTLVSLFDQLCTPSWKGTRYSLWTQQIPRDLAPGSQVQVCAATEPLGLCPTAPWPPISRALVPSYAPYLDCSFCSTGGILWKPVLLISTCPDFCISDDPHPLKIHGALSTYREMVCLWRDKW